MTARVQAAPDEVAAPIEKAEHVVVGLTEHMESPSSSLSDPEDHGDEPGDAMVDRNQLVVMDGEPNDSEAETERLDNTPRGIRVAKDIAADAKDTVDKSPSKLVRELSPLAETDSVVAAPQDEAIRESSPLMPEPVLMQSIKPYGDEEFVGRKRKRSTPSTSSLSDAPDEPPRKRANSAHAMPPADDSSVSHEDEQHNVEDEEDEDNEDTVAAAPVPTEAPLADEVEEEAAEEPSHDAGDVQPVAKVTKGRKPKGKAKKMKESRLGTGVNGEDLDLEDAGEEDVEDDDANAVDGELAKKRSAWDSLATIEKQFRSFTEKIRNEQIAQLTHELELVQQPNCQHPEYLARLRCVDERRGEKIRHEDTLLRYKLQALRVKTVAEHTQLHSQYFQKVRDVRSDTLEECSKQFYALQNERRHWGGEEYDYAPRFTTKRSQQVQQQTAYNLEVSVLSGIAKHVGFPAAPELKEATASEIEADLRAMRVSREKVTAANAPPAELTAQIPAGPPRPMQFVRTNNQPIVTENNAASEQFLEQTPWANPNYPFHLYNQLQNVSQLPRVGGDVFSTPATRQDSSSLQAVNGSVSTIEMASDPPSSNAAPGSGMADPVQRRQQADTPTRPLKRAAASLPDVARSETNHTPIAHIAHKPPSIPTLKHDGSALGQTFPTSAIHVGDPREVYDNPPLGPRMESLGTPVHPSQQSTAPHDKAPAVGAPFSDRIAGSPHRNVPAGTPFGARPGIVGR